ncbi:hypothetical protein D9M69_629750 [compost metagenome]
MSERVESLLVLSTSRAITMEAKDRMVEAITPLAQAMGCEPLVLTDGLEVGVHADLRPLLESIVVEQQKTNSLLAALVEALAEEGQDPDAPPARYLDGSKVR